MADIIMHGFGQCLQPVIALGMEQHLHDALPV